VTTLKNETFVTGIGWQRTFAQTREM